MFRFINRFIPTLYSNYFNCIDCSSSLVAIEEDNVSKELFFKCQRCSSIKDKKSLIQDLNLSLSFRATHTIISFLALYSNSLDQEDMDNINQSVRENEQVSRILSDDVFDFFHNLFGE